MRRKEVISLVLVGVVLGLAASCVASVRVGTMLDPYAAMRAEQVAGIGRVASIRCLSLTKKDGRTRVYPIVHLELEEALHGDMPAEFDIIVFNGVCPDGSEWIASVNSGAPWVLPGDRIVFKAGQYEYSRDGTTWEQYYRLRAVSFLDDPEKDASEAIYEYRGGLSAAGGPQLDPGKTPGEVLGSIRRSRVKTGYTLQDIRNAIRRNGDD